MKIFDILKDVIQHKSGKLLDDPEFESAFNPFMIARFLSMRKDLVPYASWLNSNNKNLTKENMYRYLLMSIPRSNNSYIRYIKKVKQKKEEED